MGLYGFRVPRALGETPRLALHCILQLMQAPVRIVFYLRVREAWIDLKTNDSIDNEMKQKRMGSMGLDGIGI